MKSILFSALLISTLFLGCTKEANRQKLGAYFKYQANGEQINISEEILWKENTFECTIKGDTALYIYATKVYNGAGFVLKAKKVDDDTYLLNNVNKAFYENPKDNIKYWTSDAYTGSITIKKGTYKASTLVNTLEGKFYYETYSPTSRKVVKISNGEFLMEVKYQ